jgi:dGTPase
MLEWSKLLLSDRRPKKDGATSPTKGKKLKEYRTEIERDYDRILFSTPVRRLADKTQVFPLERNDSVRTRLTHSHEVSNLARSIGVALVNNRKVFKKVKNADRDVPAMLGAIGLAHDLGNPPFGHKGEAAIASWFEDNKKLLEGLTKAQMNDFKRFEGNAQTFRIASRLQVVNDDRGLNLTYGTLAALMKYTVPSDGVSDKKVAAKKFGFFQSEANIADEVWHATGLKHGVRHPLTYVMEACDDIAYSVLDVEDAVKKGLVSFADVIAWLEQYTKEAKSPAGLKTLKLVIKSAKADHEKFRTQELSASELNDVSMQKLRVYSIGRMVSATIERFEEVVGPMLACEYENELIADSYGGDLRDALKKFARRHAYTHRSVLEVELYGHKIIRSLMSTLWEAISAIRSDKADPFHRYVYGRISENYRRVAEANISTLSERYRDLQLLTDMISGMTDGFALSLHREIERFVDAGDKKR